MSLSQILPIMQGVGYGLTSIEVKRLENSVRAGENAYLTAALQTSQAEMSITFSNKIFEATGQQPLSWAIKSIIYLTPYALGYVKKNNLIPERVRPIVVFFQSHLGSLYQTAVIASAIALYSLGQPVFAIASLVPIILGFMDQNGLMPECIRQLLHKCSGPLQIVTGLFTEGITGRVFSILSIISICANFYLSRKGTIENLSQGNLDYQKMRDFLSRKIDFKINPNFIHCNPFAPVPEIDIEILLQKFDGINWENNMHALREKLRRDQRFIERHRNPDLKTNQEIIDIAKSSLKTFLTSIKNHSVRDGEPVDYEKLHNYIKIIANYVQNKADETTRTDILFRLAVEGGEYCGPGKFEVAESIYAQTVGETPEVPFKDKVLHCLQDERNLWIQRHYFEVTRNLESLNYIDWNDIHNYNLFVNLWGNDLGLRKTAADNDEAAIIDPLVKLLVYYLSKDTIKTPFWKDHTLSDHEKTLIASIGTSKLPKLEVYAFWNEWIERQNIEEDAKQILRDELSNAKLFNIPLEIRGKFNPIFIAPMLYDMGIAEIGKENEVLSAHALTPASARAQA